MERAFVWAIADSAVKATKFLGAPTRPVDAISISVAVIWTGQEGAINASILFIALALSSLVVTLAVSRAILRAMNDRAVRSRETLIAHTETGKKNRIHHDPHIRLHRHIDHTQLP